MALAVAMNAITALGVIAFGWPAGNVFVLFWVENVVIGGWNIVRIVTARGQGGSPVKITINGRRSTPGRVGLALFFCVHYGIFCVVHAVFTGFVAYTLGVEATFGYLGLPIVLIMVRYAVETYSVWFGAGQREVVSPGQAMAQPYPRVVVLQVAVLIAFGALLAQQTGDSPAAHAPAFLRPWLNGLDALIGQDGWLVLLLILLKTVADVWTTARSTRV